MRTHHIIHDRRLISILLVMLIMSTLALLATPLARATPELTSPFPDATPIQAGLANAKVTITLGSGDVHHYALTTPANRTYVIETYNIDGTGRYATGLWLFNEAGNEIAKDNDGRTGTGNANARLSFTFTTAGTYYIRVRRSDWQAWTGTYSIRVLPKYDEPGAAWDADNDNEPNDTRMLANEIKVGLEHAQTRTLFNHSGFVTNGSDRDYYRFDAVANRTYVIETYNIDGTGRYATGLWLFNDAGTEIAKDNDGRRGTGNANARLIFTPTTTGVYFILVQRSDWQAWTGTYSIRVLPKYDQPGAAWDNNNEPNDEIPLANELELGVAGAQTRRIFAHANLVSNGPDRDFYRFTAEAGKTYLIQTFNVELTSGGYGTGLWLYSASGTLLANDQNGRNGSGNVNAQITFTFTNPGVYYIMVQRNAWTPWSGPYSIRACEESCASSASSSVYLPLIRR